MARDQPGERSVRPPVARGRADACHQRAIAHAEDLLVAGSGLDAYGERRVVHDHHDRARPGETVSLVTWRARGRPKGAYLSSRRVGWSETKEPGASPRSER